MAGFRIPMVQEGETKKKRNIGRVWSETAFLNIFSFRANGNLIESFVRPHCAGESAHARVSGDLLSRF
jgi:hypothetical protein